MTEQDAIENFKRENKILSQYAETKFQKEVFAKKIERNNIAIKALEKQIAKEVKFEPWMNTECDCGFVFSVHHGDGYHSIPYENQTKYCPNCGQKLDWGEEE